MKKSLVVFVLIGMALHASAQFTSQNINLYARWFDSTVVQEPNYHIKYNSIWGWKNTLQNKEYAILGSTAGTYFIDVSNPSNPVKCDYVAGRRAGCIWREFKTYSHYAYLVSDDPGVNSLQIVDLNYLPDSVHVVYDSNQLFQTSHTVFIDGSKLYCGYNRTLTSAYSMAVYDLAPNPELPVFLRSLSQDDPGINLVHDMFVRNDTVYASCGYQGLYVYKFTGTAFVSLGSLTNYPFSGYNHSSAMAPGSHKMVFCDEVPAGLPAKVVDVTNPANMVFKSSFESTPNSTSTPHNPFMLGESVIIAYYQDGLQIFDVSDPMAVTRTGYYDTNPDDCPTCPNPDYSGCWGAYVDLPSGIILASDMQNGLFILDANAALGIKNESLETDLFSVYPNPAKDKLSIHLKQNLPANTTLEVSDMNGKILLSETIVSTAKSTQSIPVEMLESGLYVLKVSYGNETFIRKFSKL
ncbi:MAG: choice-of-anchor B family protein [Bacteroidetes bacterium]|nr:choice-of-anchor B family protein [Bacteroidota bacterium]